MRRLPRSTRRAGGRAGLRVGYPRSRECSVSAILERFDGLTRQPASILHVWEPVGAQPFTVLGGRTRGALLGGASGCCGCLSCSVDVRRKGILECRAVLLRLTTDAAGRPTTPWAVRRAIAAAKVADPAIPRELRFHDLRHYHASLLIGHGLDIKVVQTRLRHASATTTLNTYGHLWPDADESARAAVGQVLATRADDLRTFRAS